jgi:hypothetical protein
MRWNENLNLEKFETLSFEKESMCASKVSKVLSFSQSNLVITVPNIASSRFN